MKRVKNIDIPPKSPFDKGGLGRFAPRCKYLSVCIAAQYSCHLFLRDVRLMRHLTINPVLLSERGRYNAAIKPNAIKLV